MKAIWLKVWRVLRWFVGIALVATALDGHQNPGDRAVAAVVILGYYVHLQLRALRQRHEALASQLQAITDGARKGAP